MACYCCVSGCNSNNHRKKETSSQRLLDKHFFRFPKNDMKRQRLWRRFSRSLNKTAVICDDHFDRKYLVKKNKKVKLTNDAVPTIFYKKTRDGIEKVTIEFDGDNFVGAEAEAMDKDNKSSQDQEILAIETAFINEQVKLDDIKMRCRFCAETKDEVVEISSFAAYNIDIENLLRFLNLHIIDSDCFPSSVCEECFNQVLSLETFIVKCKSADQWLWEEIGMLKTISTAIASPKQVSEFNQTLSQESVQVERLEIDVRINESFGEIIEECDSETDLENPENDELGESINENKKDCETPIMDPSCNKFARKRYSCEICLIVFAGLKTYRNHVCDVPAIQCSECGDSFKTVFDLKKHRKYLHIENLPKNYCPICKQVITGKLTVFKKHKTKCNRERVGSIQCELCHKDFSTLHGYTVHKMFHDSKNNAEKDVLETGKPSKKKPDVICEQCGKTYTTIGDCRRHIKLKHTKITEVFSCDICNKNYPSKSVLKDHFRNTHVVNEVACTFCGKVFRNKTHLKKHMVYHDDSKKVHKCTICPNQPGFINKVGLLRHQTRHANNEEKVYYNCEICVNYNFHTSFQLKSHLKHVHGIDQ